MKGKVPPTKIVAANGENAAYQQYLTIKGQYPDALLLFRVDGTFQAFDSDAQVVAQVAGVSTTQLRGHTMAGFPAAAVEAQVEKILAAGFRVGICEPVSPNTKGGVDGKEVQKAV